MKACDAHLKWLSIASIPYFGHIISAYYLVWFTCNNILIQLPYGKPVLIMACICSLLLISLWNIADNRDPHILIHVKPTYTTNQTDKVRSVRSHHHEHPITLFLRVQKGTPRLVARVRK